MKEAPKTSASDYATDCCFERILKRNNEMLRKESAKLLKNYETILREKLLQIPKKIALLDDSINGYKDKLEILITEVEKIMSKQCDCCQGIGRTLGVGGMIKPCEPCNGKGYIKDEKNDTNIDIVESKKEKVVSRRTPRKTKRL